MTPLPRDLRDPRDPRVSSQKLYVAVFYNEFGTIALPSFGKQLYVGVFCNDFGTFARPIFY